MNTLACPNCNAGSEICDELVNDHKKAKSLAYNRYMSRYR